MVSFPFNLWVVPARRPIHPEVIAALDYGMTVFTLNSAATKESLEIAARFLANFPAAKIVFGTSGHSFESSDLISTELKELLLKGKRVREDQFLYAGAMVNSVTEARAVRAALAKEKISPKEILVICDRLHSRSTRFIWGRTFPNVRISLFYLHTGAWQPNHIFPAQRTEWRWFMANVKRQAALRIMGLDWVAKFKHKA